MGFCEYTRKMIIRHSKMRSTYYLLPREMRFEDVPLVQQAGFTYWEPQGSPKGTGAWFASDIYTVLNLMTVDPSATVGGVCPQPGPSGSLNLDFTTFNDVNPYVNNINVSRQIAPAPLNAPCALPSPPGLSYLPFQEVGILLICKRFMEASNE